MSPAIRPNPASQQHLQPHTRIIAPARDGQRSAHQCKRLTDSCSLALNHTDLMPLLLFTHSLPSWRKKGRRCSSLACRPALCNRFSMQSCIFGDIPRAHKASGPLRGREHIKKALVLPCSSTVPGSCTTSSTPLLSRGQHPTATGTRTIGKPAACAGTSALHGIARATFLGSPEI